MTESHTNAHRPINHRSYGPGELIACVPGALGFYPQESLVLIGLERSGPDPSAFALGPIVRADLGSGERLEYALRALELAGQDIHLAIIVTRIPNSRLALEAAYFLEHSGSERVPGIAACWHVSEIASGTPYTLLFDAAGASAANTNTIEPDAPPEYYTGTVPSVVGAPTMRGLLQNGLLPELNREEIALHFESASAADTRRCEALYEAAYAQGRELTEHRFTRPDALFDAAERGCEMLNPHRGGSAEQAGAFPAGTGAKPVTLADCFASDEDVQLLAALLSHSHLRDSLIVDIVENPETAARLLLSIARNFTGVIRANALSLWAIAAVESGLEPWAFAALRAAQDEVPGHSLSAIQRQLMAIGEWEGMLDTAVAGCRLLWEELEDNCAA